MQKHKRPEIAKAISKKNNAGVITAPGFKLVYKDMETKAAWRRHKTRVEQWARTEDLEINPGSYINLILDTGARNTC
jgi:hypothetical protein